LPAGIRLLSTDYFHGYKKNNMSEVLINFSVDIYTDAELVIEVQSAENHMATNSDFPTPSPALSA
jgi:hypothetical protein